LTAIQSAIGSMPHSNMLHSAHAR